MPLLVNDLSSIHRIDQREITREGRIKKSISPARARSVEKPLCFPVSGSLKVLLEKGQETRGLERGIGVERDHGALLDRTFGFTEIISCLDRNLPN
jgi:hypothetical protein